MILTENVKTALELARTELDDLGCEIQSDLFELMTDAEFDAYMLAAHGVRA